MKEHELISVLVPVYNVEAFIAKCAESLFNQTYEKLQFIFVNDASTDESLNILSHQIGRYPNRRDSIIVINNDYNQGLSAVRNIALSHSSGQYIVHVDGDDYLEPNAIEELYETAKNTEADLVVGDFVSDYKLCSESYTHTKYTSKNDYLLDVIHRKVPCCIWGKLIRKDLITKNNITSIDGVSYGEDFVVTVRLIDKASRVAFLHKIIYHYVKTNQQSITANINEKSISDLLRVNEVLCSYFNDDVNLCDRIRLYTKLLLLKQISDRDLLEKASQIYQDTKNYSFISMKDRVVLELANRSYFGLLAYLNLIYKILSKFRRRSKQ